MTEDEYVRVGAIKCVSVAMAALRDVMPDYLRPANAKRFREALEHLYQIHQDELEHLDLEVVGPEGDGPRDSYVQVSPGNKLIVYPAEGYTLDLERDLVEDTFIVTVDHLRGSDGDGNPLPPPGEEKGG